MKPLSANRQGYSQQEIESVMFSGVAWFGCRVEVYDRVTMNQLPDIPQVTECSVDWDETREVKLGLSLSLLPYEPLRNAPFRYWVKPVFQVGPMPDNGWAEFAVGVYPWTRPKRRINGLGQEEWTIELGDVTHLLQLSGPHGESSFWIHRGVRLSHYIMRILGEVGIPSSYVTSRTTGFALQDLIYSYDSSYRFPEGHYLG